MTFRNVHTRSIDLVSHKVAEKLKKVKQRGKSQESGQGISAALQSAAEAQQSSDDRDVLEQKYKNELGDDTQEWSKNFVQVVKTKTFDMPAISVEEALYCLDLIEHPFYVFRNKDTGEINVVYKREGEGAGLIQPADGGAL